MEDGNSNRKAWADLLLERACISPLGVQVIFSLCPHIVEKWSKFLLGSQKDANPICRRSALLILSNHVYLQNMSWSQTITSNTNVLSAYEFGWRMKHSVKDSPCIAFENIMVGVLTLSIPMLPIQVAVQKLLVCSPIKICHWGYQQEPQCFAQHVSEICPV